MAAARADQALLRLLVVILVVGPDVKEGVAEERSLHTDVLILRVQRVIVAVVLIHEVPLVLGGVVGVLDCRAAVEPLHFPVLTRLSVPLFLLLWTLGLADVGGVCWGLNRVAKHSRDARRPVVLLQLFFCYLFLVGLWGLLHALFAGHGSCLGRSKRR